MKQSEFRARFDIYLQGLLRGQERLGFEIILWSSVPAITQRNDNIISQRDWRTLHRHIPPFGHLGSHDLLTLSLSPQHSSRPPIICAHHVVASRQAFSLALGSSTMCPVLTFLLRGHRIQSFNEYMKRKIKGTRIKFVDIHAASLTFRSHGHGFRPHCYKHV